MKVAIIGGASSNQLAPWQDESWETWVLGNQMQRYEGRRVSRIFEIHENLDEHDPKYPEWLASFNIPLILSDKFPIECENSIVFDYEKASQMIGENFSSSPAVMMAQAIMDGATEIGIWGIDMALDEHEYFMQRPSMEQWIGYAKGLGIKVYIHESSPLGRTAYREGRDWPEKGFSGYSEGEYSEMAQLHASKLEEIEKELASLDAVAGRIEQLKAAYQGHDGARQVYDRLTKLHRAKSAGLDVELKAIHG